MVDILSPQEAAWRLLLFLTPRSFDAGQVYGYPLPEGFIGELHPDFYFYITYLFQSKSPRANLEIPLISVDY